MSPKGPRNRVVSGAVAFVVMLAVAGGLLLWQTEGGDRAQVVPNAPAVERPKAPEPLESTAAPPQASDPVARTEAPIATSLDSLARIFGVLQRSDGAPLANASLRFHGALANSERVARFGEPKDWQDPTVTTDAEGHFDFRFDPPQAYQFFLSLEEKEGASAHWRWVSIAKKEVKDLGIMRLPGIGTIEGRIVDVDGKPVPGKWRAEVSSEYRPASDGGESGELYAKVDSNLATFRIDRVPVGPARVSAKTMDSTRRLQTGSVRVPVKEGQTANVELLFVEERPTAPDAVVDNGSRIRVRATGKPFASLAHATPALIVLLGLGDQPVGAKRSPNDPTSISFENVPPGEYTVELRDPAFEPFSKSGVKPGDLIEVPLVGTSGIQLTVKRRSDGARLDVYRLRALVEGATFHPNEYELRKANEPAPPSGIYRGFFARSYRLTVDAEGFPPTSASVADLAAGEIRAVEVVLDKGAKVRGHVLAGSEAIAGVTVKLAKPGVLGPSPKVQFGEEDPSILEEDSDATGAFEFGPLAAGRYELQAVRSADVKSKSTAFEIVPGGGDATIDLHLPGTGSFEGIVKSQDGTLSFTGLDVVAISNSTGEPDLTSVSRGRVFMAGRGEDKSAISKVDSSGTFAFDALPEGGSEFWLRLPAAQTLSSSTGVGFIGVPPLLLGTVEIKTGEKTERTFVLTDHCPGVLNLNVTVNGEAAANALVVLVSEAGDQEITETLGGTVLDGSGKGKMGPLKASTGRLCITGSGDLWFASWPNLVTVAGGVETKLTFALTYTDAEIVLVHAKDRSPLIGCSAGLRFGANESYFAQTDAHGVMRVGLGPGEYDLVIRERGARFPEGVKTAHLVWPAASGNRIEFLIP